MLDNLPNHFNIYLDLILCQIDTYSWARERDKCDMNPCEGVHRNSETARTRYIEDWEYNLIHKLAQDSGTPYLSPAMELAYLCRARRNEVFSLTRSDVTEKGVYINRTKGSLPEFTQWSPRLKEAVKNAQAINKTTHRRV